MSIVAWHHALFIIFALCTSELYADVAAPLSLLNHETVHHFDKNFNAITPAQTSHHQSLKLSNAQQSTHETLGSKTAHLMELKKVIKPLVLPHGYKAAIPPFLGISHDTVISFLNDMGFDFKKLWQETVVSQDHHELNKELFLERVEKIGKQIESIFVAYAQNYSSQKTTLLKKLRKFIKPRITSGKFITVRSTGKEDTDTVTNAGGNESKEIVQADIASVLRAMGAVLASYFSQKSFAQRLAEADTQIFQTPLLAVLIQEVVGEFDGNMVAGGVAYTQENLGNTPGVALVQATHGHCKAVVDSVFPSDTFYLHNDGTAVSLLARKPARFAPDPATAQLNVVTNNQALATTSSLDQEALTALAITLQAIHEFYAKPMDVEFVIDQTDKIIWIVQARPLKQLKQNSIPTYINPAIITQLEHNNIIRCTKLNEDDGTVRHITDAKKIIVAHKLDDALMLYLDEMKSEQISAQIVIVQGNAQATSHAAATLKGCGVAILCVPDIQSIKEILERQHVSLFIDLQQGLFINGLSEEILRDQDLESLTQKEIITFGRFNHPIPSIISVSPLQGPLKHFTSMHPSLSGAKLQNFVEQLKDGNAQQAREVLTHIQSIVQNGIDNLYTFTEQHGLAATHALKKLYPLALNLEPIYHQIHEKMSAAPRSLERLYPIALLEALLFQEKREGLLKNYSLQSVMNQFQADFDFIEKYSNETFCNYTALKIARMGANQALTSTIADQWVQVIAQQSKRKLIKKAPIILFFAKFKILPLFINMMFSRTNPKKFNHFFKSIAREFTNNQEFFEKLSNIKNEIDAIDLEEWQKPESFERLFDQLNNVFIPFCTSHEFNTHATQNVEKLSALATLSLMETIISYVDLATKAVKSRVCQNSNQTQEKCVQFKKLLDSYFLLLEAWAPQAQSVLALHESYPPQEYLKALKRLFDQMQPSEAQCNPTKDFNVAAAALGSAAAFERCAPQTLEDVFTTIHQSLLNILGALIRNTIDRQWIKLPTYVASKLNFAKKIIPMVLSIYAHGFDNLIALLTGDKITGCYFSKLLNACLLGNVMQLVKSSNAQPNIHRALGIILRSFMVNDFGSHYISPSLTGISCSADTTEYTVNVPLRNHSASIKLIASHKTDDLQVNMQFYGMRPDRWHQINSYVKLASKAYNYGLDEAATVLNKNGISFSLTLKPEVDATKLHDIVKNASAITFHESDSFLQGIIKELLLQNPGTISAAEIWNESFFQHFLPRNYYGDNVIKPEKTLAQIKQLLSSCPDAPSDEEILHGYIQELCDSKRSCDYHDLYQLTVLAQEHAEISSADKELIQQRISKIMKEISFYYFNIRNMSKILTQLLHYFSENTDGETLANREMFFEKFFLNQDLEKKTCEFPELFDHWVFERNLKQLAAFPELEQEFYRYLSDNNQLEKLITLFVRSGTSDEENPHKTVARTVARIKNVFAQQTYAPSEQEILHLYIQELCSSRYHWAYGKLYQLITIYQTCPEISQDNKKLIKNTILKIANEDFNYEGSYSNEKKAFELLLSFFATNTDTDTLPAREQFFKRYFLEKIDCRRNPRINNALDMYFIKHSSSNRTFKQNIKKLRKFPALEQEVCSYLKQELIKYYVPNCRKDSLLTPQDYIFYIKFLFSLFTNPPSETEIIHQYIQELCLLYKDIYNRVQYILSQLFILDQTFSEISLEDQKLIKQRIFELIRSDAYYLFSPEILKYFADNITPETLELRKKIFDKHFLDKQLTNKKSVTQRKFFTRKPYTAFEALSPLDKNMLELAKFPELEKDFYHYAFEQQMTIVSSKADFVSDQFRQFPWANFLTPMLESEGAIQKLLEHTQGNDQATLELFEYLFDEIYFVNESCQKLIIQKAREYASTETKYAWELKQLLEQHAHVLG